MRTGSNLKALQTLSQKHRQILSNVSLPYYVQNEMVLETGQPFDFKDHPYLFAIYEDMHPHTVFKKSAQVGITTFAFIKSIWACQYLFKLGVGYFFPTSTDMRDFCKSRINEFLKYNKNLKINSEGETDNITVKKIGKSFLYLRGLKSESGIKSFPADMIVKDELDEADPYHLDMASHRTDHSDFKWTISLSNPTIEEYGIDKEFLASDQRYWHLKCSHCGEWNCLDKEFPNCLHRIKGNVIRVCRKCKKIITLDEKGEWVQDIKQEGLPHGYHISQLFSKYMDPKTILDEYEAPSYRSSKENFYRLRLGKAYTAAQNRVSKEKVLQLPRGDIKGVHGLKFIGIDQNNGIHVVVGKLLKDDKVGIEELIIVKDFEEIDSIIKKHKPTRVVEDALPEKRKALELAGRHEGLVFANFYIESVKGTIKFDMDKKICEENRTENLDGSNELLQADDRLIIDNNISDKDLELFAAHCSNMARKKEEEDDGTQKYMWVRTGPDHYRHALNYMYIAMSEYVNSGMSDIKTVASQIVDKAPKLQSSGVYW